MRVIFQTAPRSSRRPSRWCVLHGFTLIEVMLVVGIMAIILAMGVPPMVRILSKEPLRQGASDIMEALGHARAQAILQGVPAELVIGIDTNVFFLVSKPAVTSLTNGTAKAEAVRTSSIDDEAAGRPVFLAHLHEAVRITFMEVNFSRHQQDTKEDVRVRFFPNGTSDDFTIVLEEGSGQRKVSLDPVTALAELEVVR